MEEITKDSVLTEHNKTPLRKCFFNNSEIQRDKPKPTFSVSIKSAMKVFEAQTGLSLIYNPGCDKYFRYVTPKEIEQIERWEKLQGSLIYLRDCMSLSVALDSNFIDNVNGQYTKIGHLESLGKKVRDPKAIRQLADEASHVIQCLPFYQTADLICSVPPRPDKDFDLPSSVTSLVSGKVGKRDVTSGFVFNGQKSSVKTATLHVKWDVWENSQVFFHNTPDFNVENKTIILIDDKYQSGITIQYIAMKLQQAGAREVYGLSFVKTLRNTDNV